MAKMNQAMSDLLRYNAAMLPRKRSSFDKSHSHTTTFNSGYIIPLMWDRVLPGDEKKIKYSGLARMSTPIHPTMDEANLDVWCFYVPDRLWWTHAKEFYGENKDASFNPDGHYVMPYLKPVNYRVRPSDDPYMDDTIPHSEVGGLSDYFGFPVMKYEDAVRFNEYSEFNATAGLHRSYQLIWNEWFRNSSIQPALQLNDGDEVTYNELDVILKLRKANKYPDYFTTLLREPQAGEDVLLPLGDFAPVVTNPYGDIRDYEPGNLSNGGVVFQGNGSVAGNLLGTDYNGTMVSYPLVYGTTGSIIQPNTTDVFPINLWANLTNASATTINNLRAAITVQHLLEVDALAGKRYQQILQAHFGVFTPDATLQRPELLGATRTKIGMRQVVQTSESTDASPLGNTSAFSLTNVSNEWICNKSFTEPGFIMVLGCVRPNVSYSQGLDPLLTKLERYDHYWPVFDNLGNQPVPKSAIYMGNSPDSAKATLGFAEAWTEYRIKNNRVSGYMRPDVPQSLASWNYSLNFNSYPSLDSNFIAVDPSTIDRTLAIQSTENPEAMQFICDSYFEYYDIKNMSVHSIPGLNRL